MSPVVAPHRSPGPSGVSARTALAAHAERTNRGSSTVANGFGPLVAHPVESSVASVLSIRAPRGYEVEAWRVAPGGRMPRSLLSCVDGDPGFAYASGGSGLHRFRTGHAVDAVHLETAVLVATRQEPCHVGTTAPVEWLPTDRLAGHPAGGFEQLRGLWWCSGDDLLYLVERRDGRDVVWGFDPGRGSATALYVPPHDFALVRPSEICASDPAGAGIMLVEQPGAARTTTIRLLGHDGRVSPLAELRGPSRPAVVRFDPEDRTLIVSFPSVGLVVRIAGSFVTGEDVHAAVPARAAVHGRSLAMARPVSGQANCA